MFVSDMQMDLMPSLPPDLRPYKQTHTGLNGERKMAKITLMHAGPSQMPLPMPLPFLCAVKPRWRNLGTFRAVIEKEGSVPKAYCCWQTYFQDFHRQTGAAFPYQARGGWSA